MDVALAMVVFAWPLSEAALHGGYTNEWVAEIGGGRENAQRIAEQLGFNYRREMRGLKDHYIMARDDFPDISSSGSHFLTRSLRSQPEVKWAEQQKRLRLTNNGVLPDESKLGVYHTRGIFDSVEDPINYDQPNLENLGTFSTRPGRGHLKNYKGPTLNIGLFSKKISAYNITFNDELWPKQWYFHDYRTEDGPVMDHNVVPVYRMNITGDGVIVAVVDSGVQQDHPDLGDNFVENLSYDYLHSRKGSDPGKIVTDYTTHGTNSAGVVAMLSNNTMCGIGVAFKAKVAGILVVGEKATDYHFSESLLHAIETIDIYTNSNGAQDNGKDLITNEPLTYRSIEVGAWQGRKGKGAVYVFAAGNSRRSDHCAADEMISSPYMILVASANQIGKPSWFSERCAAIMTTAYSGCVKKFEEVISLKNDGKCDTTFSGTSASTPIISGILALALQANKELTYRDVQHLITMSSEVAPLANNPKTWYKNGAGFWVSNDFGFGLLNAENTVLNALAWKTVPNKVKCTVVRKPKKKLYFDFNEAVYLDIPTDKCKDDPSTSVNYLEHIELSSDIEYVYRGAVAISLISPKGTRTVMMAPRWADITRGGFKNFNILSTHTWGEDPNGVWFVEIEAKLKLTGRWALYDKIVHAVKKLGRSGPAGYRQSGYVHGFTLKLHGTAERPHSMRRKYAGFRLPNGRTDLT